LLDNNIDVSSSLSTLGLSKLNIGDINDDGVDDFVVSHFTPNSISPDDEIVFTCYSGKDLSVLYSINVPNPNHLLVGLSSIIIPQDVDGDGHNDFISGLYQLIDNQLILKDFIIISSKTGMPIDYKR
jgi:hypothetical protein